MADPPSALLARVMSHDGQSVVPGVPVVMRNVSGPATLMEIDPPEEVAVTEFAKPVLNETMPRSAFSTTD